MKAELTALAWNPAHTALQGERERHVRKHSAHPLGLGLQDFHRKRLPLAHALLVSLL